MQILVGSITLPTTKNALISTWNSLNYSRHSLKHSSSSTDTTDTPELLTLPPVPAGSALRGRHARLTVVVTSPPRLRAGSLVMSTPCGQGLPQVLSF